METEEDSLAEAFWSVARQLRNLSREALAPWEVSPSQVRALRMLARHRSMRLSELADHLRIAPRSATEVVDGLEERGLAAREADPTDRRATLINLSRRGDELTHTFEQARADGAERLFERITQLERDQLRAILRKLQGNG